MSRSFRFTVLPGLLLLLFIVPLRAQDRDEEATVPAYTAERNLIESILGTVVGVLQEATLRQPSADVSDRLRAMALQLSDATAAYTPPADGLRATPAAYSREDLLLVEDLLATVRDQVREIRADLERDNPDAAERLLPVEQRLTEAMGMLRRMARNASDAALATWTVEDDDQDAGWTTEEEIAWHDEDDIDGDDAAWVEDQQPDWRDPDGNAYADAEPQWRDDHRRRSRWHATIDRLDRVDTFVGDLSYRWPYRETAIYRPIPSIRYNRVEGLVLGIGLPPLDWYDYDHATLYGQLAYAFQLERWRYEIGAEARPFLDYRNNDGFGFKVGAAYRRNTTTEDLWKMSWAENSLAAFFIEGDYFDYYEAEGWTVYAVQRLTRYAQVSVGYRSEIHRSLDVNTRWSLFGGQDFRPNPGITSDSSRMNTVAIVLEGGRVADLHRLPSGIAFRTAAELGDGLGGDYAFNRYQADVRMYIPMSPFSSLGLRIRGGYASDGTPLQKQFTLGGVGSVRAYPQNSFFGTRMLLANAELIIGNASLFDDVLDDIQFLGLFDAGWTNGFAETDTFRMDDVIPAAGFGIALDDRDIRLELAWPLRDLNGNGYSPSLWLRLNPTF